jgi:hypothetical protein
VSLLESVDFGNKVVLPGPGSAGNSTRLFQAACSHHPDGRTVSIAINTVTAVPAGFTGRYAVFAVISWGSKRTGTQVTVDCTVGTRISVEAVHTLAIDAYMVVVAGGVGTPSTSVAATCSYGAVGGPTQNTLTVDAGEIDAGIETGPFPVAAFAKDVTFFSDDADADAFEVIFRSGPGAGGVIAKAHGQTGLNLTIPNGATQIGLFNNQESPILVQMVFDLRI